MKRFAALFIALALLLCALPAFAEGKIEVTQENFHVVGTSSFYGYLFLKLENTGDAPAKLDGGEMELYNANGDVLGSTTTMWRYAEYLKPGEYTYAYFTTRAEGVESADEVTKYSMTFNTKDSADKETFRLPVESMYEDDVTEGYWTHDYMTTTVTNDTDQTVYDVTIVRALLDADGNILNIDSDSMYSYKGIASGSAIVLRRQMGNNFTTLFEEKGYVPATVDAIAYVYVTDPNTYTRGGAGATTEQVEEPEQKEETGEDEVTYETLQQGDSGRAVKKLQKRLIKLGYLTGKADGKYGKGTAKAVKAFQKKAGLKKTGIADDATQKALFADDAPAA